MAFPFRPTAGKLMSTHLTDYQSANYKVSIDFFIDGNFVCPSFDPIKYSEEKFFLDDRFVGSLNRQSRSLRQYRQAIAPWLITTHKEKSMDVRIGKEKVCLCCGSKKMGIMKGDEFGFRPNDSITREETAQAIANVLKYLGK